MKLITLFLFAILVQACGSEVPTVAAPKIEVPFNQPDQDLAPGKHQFRLRVWGDNVAFVGNMFADMNTPDEQQFQISPNGPVTIPAGQTLVYYLSAYDMTSSTIQRTTQSGVRLHFDLYDLTNGANEAAWLDYAGEHHDFQFILW